MNDAETNLALVAPNASATANALRLTALNAAVAQLDVAVQEMIGDGSPETQMSVLMLAQVKAFRRVLTKHNVTNRGRRHRVMKQVMKDFESKLTRYALDADEPALPAAAAVPD